MSDPPSPPPPPGSWSPSRSPEALAARYEDVRERSETTELAPERWAALEAKASEWGVGAFCYHDGAVLLVRENEEWLLPGGILEAGEPPEEGARRELREETGVEANVEGLAAITTRTFLDRSEPQNRFEFRFGTFVARASDPTTSDDPGLDGEGIETVAWRSEIPGNTFDRELVVDLSRSVLW